jgi:hypothetical protein
MAIRNKMVLVGALLAVAMLANVSLALNTWTGADPNSDPAYDPNNWFRPGNWDASTVVPPIRHHTQADSRY